MNWLQASRYRNIINLLSLFWHFNKTIQFTNERGFLSFFRLEKLGKLNAVADENNIVKKIIAKFVVRCDSQADIIYNTLCIIFISFDRRLYQITNYFYYSIMFQCS